MLKKLVVAYIRTVRIFFQFSSISELFGYKRLSEMSTVVLKRFKTENEIKIISGKK